MNTVLPPFAKSVKSASPGSPIAIGFPYTVRKVPTLFRLTIPIRDSSTRIAFCSFVQKKICAESAYYAVATTVLTKVSPEYMKDQYHYNQHVLNMNRAYYEFHPAIRDLIYNGIGL